MVARKPSTAARPPKARDSNGNAVLFPVVGIGASAGGLEAFEMFFRKTPTNTGMAFVLIPHLDPSHASILTAILQRSTTMSVVEAEDQMPVAPNCVYVLPPNREMTISRRSLHLGVPEQPRGHRLPIDHFLRSLAEDLGEKAIGIILSGTGTDGTQGLRAISGAGGITFAQEPETAKYNGMPTSVIQSGYVTHVLPVEKMAQALVAGTRGPVDRGAPAPADENSGLKQILALLRSGTGHDFSQYKKSTINRRIERRISQHSIENIQLYARFLKEHPAEVQLLFKELLINVTSFFRDPEAFETLKAEVFPKLFAERPPDSIIRLWVPGCATGEEAYSLAILLREFMDEARREFKVQIYSTDLDEDAILMARTGTYLANIAEDVSPERLRRFFTRLDNGFQIKKNIREMVVFAIQNVIKDPPFTRLDMISCRNLMIYLEPELQTSLIPTFHYALKPDGVLFLSSSESIGPRSDLFTTLSRKWRIYRAAHSESSARTAMASGLSWTTHRGGNTTDEMTKKTNEINLPEIARRMLLQFYAPASVITDRTGNIVYVHGETGKYLRPAPGQATLNVIEMAREGLRLDLLTAIQSAASQSAVTLNHEVTIKTDEDLQPISFSVRPVAASNSAEDLLLLSFQDVTGTPPPKPARKRAAASVRSERIQELERDLAHTRENLQAIIEEQQASNEELKSANEEMQSTNEELQSTNEELETSKEELQSVNEELITVNAELQAKIEQLADMQNDMKNLLDNISIGTIFLDQNLVIRRFTREAVRAYRLVASDVGRSLADIKSDVEEEDLIARAQTVLETLVPFEQEVRTASGQWYLARVQPYRTLDNVIEGVVLTFADIGKRVEAEAAVQDARELAEGIVDTVREPLIVLDSEFRVVSASRSFYHHFHLAPAATVGRPIYEVGDGLWDMPKLRELLEKVLPLNQSFEDYLVESSGPGIKQRTMLLNGRRVIGRKGKTQLILLAVELRTAVEK